MLTERTPDMPPLRDGYEIVNGNILTDEDFEYVLIDRGGSNLIDASGRAMPGNGDLLVITWGGVLRIPVTDLIVRGYISPVAGISWKGNTFGEKGQL